MSNKSLITPVGTASYAFVFRPQPSMNAGQEPKYSITMLIDKGKDLSELKKACLEAAEEKFGAKAKSMIQSGKLNMPFRDGDEEREDDPVYKGKVFFSAKSTTKPGVIDQRKDEIFDESEFYSGCLARISVKPFGYDVSGNRGVAFLLNNVQKAGDGERLSGKPGAGDEFGELESENDDSENESGSEEDDLDF